MEIKTCEQYVLDQLMCTENEVYQLRAANDELKARCAKLESELKARDERETSKVEQAIRKEGRAKLYRDGTGYSTSVDDGGKGALVSDEVSLTLSTSNTQTLFSEEGGDMVVRRLTPRECERLQGFPDDWTKIPYRGKPADECPDGPRYKAIGNSMAVPVMRWIGERIAMAEAGEIA